MSSKRLSNIDLLRILSTFAVVLIHVNATFYLYMLKNPELSGEWIVMTLFNVITRFSVPCFVMISGSFLLSNDKNADIVYFYKKSLVKIFIPAFIVVIFAIPVFCFLNRNDFDRIVEGLKGLITGEFYTFWYMYMLIGLYLLVPLVIRIKRSLTPFQYKFLTYLMIIWAVISQLTSKELLSSSIGVVFAFVAFFLMGDIISNYSTKRCNRVLLVLVSLTCIAVMFWFSYFHLMNYTFFPTLLFFSPSIVIYSICMFKLFLSFELKNDYSKLSGLTFEIYLFHSIVLNILQAINFHKLFHPLIAIPLMLIITVFLSGLIGYLFKLLMKKIREPIELSVDKCRIWKKLEK